MYESIPLSYAFGVIALLAAILALLGSIAMLISLSFHTIPGKRVHWMMFAISLINSIWHVLGICTSFVNSIPEPVHRAHFATGCMILWIHFIARLEILRLFEAVTFFTSKRVTKWQWISTGLFWGLFLGTWIHAIIPNDFLQLWATYWLLVWLLYIGGGFVWIQCFITIKLYQYMPQSSTEQQRKGKEEYKNIMWKHVLISMWEPVVGSLWLYGWLFEKDQVTRWCILKLGEAFTTYNILCTIIFLKNIKDFTFRKKKPSQPQKIALESRTELFQKTKPL
jgi:hypothetical protein